MVTSGSVVGYGPLEASIDIQFAVNAAMKKLLDVNKGVGSRPMREAILNIMNDLQRFMRGRFLRAGLDDDDSERIRSHPGSSADHQGSSR